MRIARRPVAVDYITLIGLWIVWVTFLTSGTPYTPPSLYQGSATRFTTRDQYDDARA